MSHFHISKSTYDELKNRHAAEEKNYLDQAETLAWDIHKKAQAIIDMTGFSPAIALEIAAGKVDVIDATLSGCHWSPEFEGVVQEIIANTRNRSDVSKTNESAQLLAKLEWEFQGNEKELAKIKSIAVVDDEHIRIAGFTHKLWVAKAPENKENGVLTDGEQTLFTHSAAMDFANAQSGYSTYDEAGLKALMNAIPGISTGRQVQIALELLQLPLAGYGFPSGEVVSVGEEVALLSSSISGGEGIVCCFDSTLPQPDFTQISAEYAFSLVLHKSRV